MTVIIEIDSEGNVLPCSVCGSEVMIHDCTDELRKVEVKLRELLDEIIERWNEHLYCYPSMRKRVIAAYKDLHRGSGE